MTDNTQNCKACGKFVLLERGQFDGRDFIAEGKCECGKMLSIIQKDIQILTPDPKQWSVVKND